MSMVRQEWVGGGGGEEMKSVIGVGVFSTPRFYSLSFAFIYFVFFGIVFIFEVLFSFFHAFLFHG